MKNTDTEWITVHNCSEGTAVTLPIDSEGSYTICVKAMDSFGNLAKQHR